MKFTKKVLTLLLTHYNSFLLIGISLWLSIASFKINYPYQATILLVASFVKLLGIFLGNKTLRIIGLMALNSFWAVNVYMFLTNQYLPIELPYQFPLFILLVGLGIGLRGQLNEG